jgi:toxin-antitoxin system PIN domain toxin
VIAVDTNILVYTHRADSPFHERALDVIADLAEGVSPWALPWPCLTEFYAVVTNRRFFTDPTPAPAAVAQVEAWLSSPSVRVLAAVPRSWTTLASLLASSKVVGGAVHDAHIAALCLDHGVKELWTADRDFSRFPALAVRNPLVG